MLKHRKHYVVKSKSKPSPFRVRVKKKRLVEPYVLFCHASGFTLAGCHFGQEAVEALESSIFQFGGWFACSAGVDPVFDVRNAVQESLK